MRQTKINWYTYNEIPSENEVDYTRTLINEYYYGTLYFAKDVKNLLDERIRLYKEDGQMLTENEITKADINNRKLYVVFEDEDVDQFGEWIGIIYNVYECTEVGWPEKH